MPPHLILLDLIPLIMLGYEYKLSTKSVCGLKIKYKFLRMNGVKIATVSLGRQILEVL
jgi:hypothetical protein